MTKFTKKITSLALASAIGLAAYTPTKAYASEPFIGQIMMFGGNFCPRGWAGADGQLLAIASHQALFSILGTTYGGDGRTSFGLPDLRGRAPIHEGNGPGLSNFPLGSKGGIEQATLTQNELPNHSHTMNVTKEIADKGGPGNKILAATPNGPTYSEASSDRTMRSDTISSVGGGQSFSIRNPYQAVTFCIALEGLFPPRN